MELGRATTSYKQSIGEGISPDDTDRAVEQRLAYLIKINAELADERSLFRSGRERTEAALMVNPIPSRKAFAYFGYMIGTLPPASIALKIIAESSGHDPMTAIFVVLLATAAVVTGMVGYVTGKYVPMMISRVDGFRLPNRIALVSLIGLVWGAVAGAAGGLFLFLIGAIFAGAFGGIIGAITLPVLSAFHQTLRRGDFIEMRHFLPIAFGITLSVCAFILGF